MNRADRGTGRIVPLGADTHQAVQALLPWYVRETLPPAEREQVASHLAACPHCQAEFEWERRVQAMHRQLPAGGAGDVEAGLAAAHAQIAALPGQRRRAVLRNALSWCRRVWRQGPRAWRWVVATQALAIVLLGLALWQNAPPPAPYRTLGAPGAATAGNAVVMFRAGTSEEGLRAALQQAGAQVVDGPTVAGAYVVRVADDAALQRLRAQPVVALATPLRSAEAGR